MKTMNSEHKLGIMTKFRNSKGFSLIEMAIVLVIIGIIIAAIIKGQDLILNSQAKKAVATTSQWRNLAMAYYDRNGRFPGDAVKNGVIGDVAGEQTDVTTAIGEIASIMEQAPENPFLIGNTSLYMYFGNVTTTSSGTRNALIICGDIGCLNALSVDQVELVKAIDTSVDGVADGGLGQFRSFTTALTMLPTPATSVNNRYARTATAISAITGSVLGTTDPWTTTYKGAVWLFDRPF